MDAVDAIMSDHRLMEELFEQLKAVSVADRVPLVAEVKARLLAHSVAEEEHVYPDLVRKDPQERDEVHHGIEEHREAEDKLAAVEAACGSDDFAATVDDFVSAVSHHVEEEESDILPSLKRKLSAERLNELGDLFESRRRSELSEAGYEGPPSPDATKDELYEQAKATGVEGRSDMNKAQLRNSLR